jgi:hypothetical protein
VIGDVGMVLHVYTFDEALEQRGVKCKKVIASGIGHAFDRCVEVGDEIDITVIDPAVEWIIANITLNKE